jgi:hypothetical protein
LFGGAGAGVVLWATTVRAAPRIPAAGWSPQSAVAYLDGREVWWQQWPRAQKDHGTVCISCHTQVPYALVRPTLRRDQGEAALSAPERAMMTSVEERVNHWAEMAPFYTDAKNGPGKTVEAHATEAVLNATMLASYDAAHGHLRPVTRTAFDHAWELQRQSGDLAGAWIWQNFHLGPWEGEESGYQGVALLMVETLHAPDGFASEPETRRHLDLMRAYLRREYAAQPVMNRLYVLWASAKEPGLLTATERNALLAAVRDAQEADGGWRTAAIDERERKDDSPEPAESDGYATGLAVLAMEESGTPPHDATLRGGLAWLAAHQLKDGSWSAESINKQRDPDSDAAPFMRDAATAYAVLALERRR